LYPRGKGNKIQEEKDDSDMTEEDFSEAMQMMKAGFHELRAL
jgi:hypothetical protein